MDFLPDKSFLINTDEAVLEVVHAAAAMEAQQGNHSLRERMDTSGQHALNVWRDLQGDPEARRELPESNEDVLARLRSIQHMIDNLGTVYSFPESEAKLIFHWAKSIGDDKRIGILMSQIEAAIVADAEAEIGHLEWAVRRAEVAQKLVKTMRPHYEEE